MTKKARRSPRDSKITRSAKKEKKQRSQEFISYYQMGGRVDKPMAEKLHITYDGKVCGLLKEGAILSNHTHGRALDPTITTCMLKSLGSVEKIKVLNLFVKLNRNLFYLFRSWSRRTIWMNFQLR